MKKKSIIIADTDIHLLTDLKNLFTTENNYSVDATTNNGRELLNNQPTKVGGITHKCMCLKVAM